MFSRLGMMKPLTVAANMTATAAKAYTARAATARRSELFNTSVRPKEPSRSMRTLNKASPWAMPETIFRWGVTPVG